MSGETTADSDIPIEVGLFGVRTFRVTRHGIEPISFGTPQAMPGPWAGGECIARCRFELHPAPAEDCNCGIHASTDLESLRSHYPQFATRVVAVIAAEGTTVLGDRGFRTAAARVVAYWCSPAYPETVSLLAGHVGGASVFTDLEEMLHTYRIRATTPPHALHQPPAQYSVTRAVTRGETFLEVFRPLLWLLARPVLSGALLGQAVVLFARLPQSAMARGTTDAGEVRDAVRTATSSLDRFLILALHSPLLWQALLVLAVMMMAVSTAMGIYRGRAVDNRRFACGSWPERGLRAAIWACSYLVAAGHAVHWLMFLATGFAAVVWTGLHFAPEGLSWWRQRALRTRLVRHSGLADPSGSGA